MVALDPGRLTAHRAETYRLSTPVRHREEGLAFVRDRGFVTFWPITGLELPSLWTAVAGDRPVAEAHDDVGHVTWGWKDQMLGSREWYYAKVIRGKATMIALGVVPAFYALSENMGDPDNDYLDLYRAGLLTREARAVYEALLRFGPLNSVRLRREANLASKAGKSPFDRALVTLQRDFRILPVGVAEAGAWRYSHVYACVHHWYPALPEEARHITRGEARQALLERYFASVGAASAGDVAKTFGWRPVDVQRTLDRLADAGIVRTDILLPGRRQPGYALPTLLD